MVVLALLLAGRVYLHQGFPYTHDGENHLARFANYKIAVREGQIPPRFAPNLQNHYGYPVFNYNYPLANIISLPFSFLHFNYELTFKFIALIGLGIMAIGVQEWVRLLKIGRVGQVAAVGLVLSSPVVLNMTFYRGNIGELLGMALTAQLLWLIERSIQRKDQHPVWIALWWIGLLLAHNITAVYASAFLLAYGLLRASQTKQFRRLSKQLFASFGIAIVCTLWFWLPALAEKQLIVLDKAGSIGDYAKHFPSFSQLLFSPLGFGFSYPGSIDTLSMSPGIGVWLVLLMSTAALLQQWLATRLHKTSTKLPNWLGWLWVASIGLIYIQTNASAWIWQLVSPLRYAQFPWRFGMFVVVLAAPLLGWLLEQRRRHWLITSLLLIGLGWQIWLAFSLKAVDYFHKTMVDYDAFSQTTSTQNENRTPSFQFESVPDWQPSASILSGEGTITTSIWRGTERSYAVEAKTPVTIVEPTMLFAGWQTTANREQVAYVDEASVAGRLAYRLEPGSYQIYSRFTQQTWSRMVGNSISTLGLLWFAAVIGWQLRKGSRAKPA